MLATGLVHPHELRALTKKFTLLLEDARLSKLEELKHKNFVFIKDRPRIVLGWDGTLLDDVASAVESLCPCVSQKRIHKAVVDLIAEILASQATIGSIEGGPKSSANAIKKVDRGEALLAIIKELRSLVADHRVFVPIENLESAETLSTQVGTVTLHSRRERDDLDCALKALEEQRDQETARLVQNMLEAIVCYAIAEVTGDLDYALTSAVGRTEEAISLLSFWFGSPLGLPKYRRIQIGRPLIAQVDNRIYYGIPFADIPSKFSPAEVPLILQNAGCSRTEAWEEFNACLQPNVKSDILKRIYRAVTWYSKAVDAISLDESFVCLAIALESLLVGRDESGLYSNLGSISQKLGERMAFLLGNEPGNRIQIEKEIKDLYGRRSRIVHNGEEIERKDLALMTYYVRGAIFAFQQHHFESWDEFLKWIAQQRYNC